MPEYFRGLHLSGADEQGPRDAVVMAVDCTKILWLLRLDGDPCNFMLEIEQAPNLEFLYLKGRSGKMGSRGGISSKLHMSRWEVLFACLITFESKPTMVVR